MGKCLITRLNEVVDDDSLNYPGQLQIYVDSENDETGERSINITSDGDVRYIIDGGHTASVGGVDKGSDFTVPSNTLVIFSKGHYKVRILSVYEITNVSSGPEMIYDLTSLTFAKQNATLSEFALSINGDIDKFAELRSDNSFIVKTSNATLAGLKGNIRSLNAFNLMNLGTNKLHLTFNDSDIVGDISDFDNFTGNWKSIDKLWVSTDYSNSGKIYGNIEGFKDYVNIIKFNINNVDNLTGNLAVALGRMINLELIAISGHAEAEDLATLFDTLHANGKVSGTLQAWPGSNKTVNGVPFVHGVITFTANGWTINS